MESCLYEEFRQVNPSTEVNEWVQGAGRTGARGMSANGYGISSGGHEMNLDHSDSCTSL